ncbi:MAG: class I SAM-dependent methyltransferase [Syntrophales bacterium]|nr:class I SAM-dependent methyltransferase [Syntrophales bacterium]
MIKSFYKKIYERLKYTTLFGRGQLIKYLEQEIVLDCSSLLDLGCGSDSPISRFSSKIPYRVGVDIFDNSIWLSKKNNIHNEYIKIDILDVENEFKENSFDCVIAIDLIEHLSKEDGLKLLRIMEKISKKKVVISTPNGFVPQNEYDGNRYQVHLSGWSYEEMVKMGFRIIGIGGWKILRGERGEIVWRPKILWFLISRFTHFYTRNHPEHAFSILCIKNL